MANIRPLSDELQKAAIEQLNEVPERIADDLDALKTWIQQQPHLTARTDDQFLVSFLRGCKYSLEKAKSKIDKYYSLRSNFPRTFCAYDVDDPKFREVLRKGLFVFLPTPLPNNGPRICIMRSGVCSPSEYKPDELWRVMYAMQDITLLEDDYAIVNGIAFISDMTNTTAAHFFSMTPKELKRMMVYGEEALPFRPKASHFVNAPSSFDTIFNIFKPMMSQKNQQRLHVHGNKMDTLHAHIPKQYLPKEYGGENGCVDELIAHWDKKFDEYRDYFKAEVQYGTNELLRPGKPLDFDGIFGTEGSFRKLEVD